MVLVLSFLLSLVLSVQSWADWRAWEVVVFGFHLCRSALQIRVWFVGVCRLVGDLGGDFSGGFDFFWFAPADSWG